MHICTSRQLEFVHVSLALLARQLFCGLKSASMTVYRVSFRELVLGGSGGGGKWGGGGGGLE